MLVLSVESIFCYWVRIIGYRFVEVYNVGFFCYIVDSKEFLELIMFISGWFVDLLFRIKYEVVLVGDLCVIMFVSSFFYRYFNYCFRFGCLKIN